MSAPNRFIGASQSDERSPEMRKMRAIAAVAASVGAVASGASAQEAVQWRVEDGGNGHWYALKPAAGFATFEEAMDYAIAMGASFMTAATTEEWLFISEVALDSLPSRHYATMGIRQDPSGAEPDEAWSWLEKSSFAIPWASGSPDETFSNEDWAHAYRYGDGAIRVNDCTNELDNPAFPFYVTLEFSADCNADGVVDYGQILAGDLVDANGNNIPDCCEENAVCATCAAADLIPNGQIDGVDLALLISAWGTDGGKFPEADIDRDGIVAGSDLALLLSYWGPCD
jgi:hypothetical protein